MTFCVNRLGKRLLVMGALALGVSAAMSQAELTLRSESSSPFDLKISAGLEGQSDGAPRYVAWEDINALPTEVLELEGEFVPGPQAVTVVFLDKLWSALPVVAEADVMIAFCADNYFSIYRDNFIDAQRPFLVLAIDGKGPDKWPPPGLSFNPGPYVISVADEVVPGVESILDVGHKKPWGVNEVRFDKETDLMAPAFAAKREQLSPSGEHGREIWINSCSSCHMGPGGLVGGNKSQRPFEVLEAHARYNEDFFRQYVREPTALVPSAKMEAHPHYTDEELDALVAFITADGA